MRNKDILEWFELYSDDIYHFLIYRLGSTDVEELVQEVFIKAIKAIERYEANASPKTWLFSIARNVAVDELRRIRRTRLKELYLQAGKEPPSSKTPEEILQLNEENRDIFLAIQSQKSNYRDVLILKGIKQLAVAEVSLILGWSENKVRSTYHRARNALLKDLGGYLNEE
ncbi:RNA polymerase sigma factor [Neobacillus novalis]|uniref:RNA polymerase sigma factor n=1 Tax=Neobacillus novalis TaxID=220687 RepID=A0AA95SDK8_9BACI|nr:RNA polymerase sigma factor [Neobacillus novalis]WHY87223.1 RNA polymerase sigma factor [Neobacillus novalis]